ncbi:MAG: LON peptidase substrate-binding domain-containing protein, partial [Candidatus Rokuibacteriota bacterium]
MTDEGIRIETSPAPPGGAGPSHADGGEAQPDVLAILPLRETVLFPQAVIPLAVARPSSVRAVDEAVLGGRLIGLLTQRDASQESPAPPDMHRTGTIATIHRMLKQPDGTIRLVVQGIERFRVVEFTQTAPYLRARIERVPDVMPAADDVEAQALGRQASALFQKVVELSPTLSDDLLVLVSSAGDAGRTIDLIAATLPSLTTAERQTLLETPDVKVRLKALVTSLTKEAEVLELGSKIHSQVQSEMTKTQREYYLREQLKAIQKELGEADDRGQELTELREKIDAVGMSEEAHREALRELGRLEKMPPAAAEYSVARTYLEWLTALPWRKETTDDLDLVRARAVLDEDHWG